MFTQSTLSANVGTVNIALLTRQSLPFDPLGDKKTSSDQSHLVWFARCDVNVMATPARVS